MAATRVYVGNLDPNLAERDLRDQFEKYGPLRSVWIARKPPGFAFVEYEDERDAVDAVKRLDGRGGWKVEFSRRGERRAGPPGGSFGGGFGGGGGGGGGGMMGRGRELRCYECNEVGHLARDCRLRVGGARRSPPPRGRSRSPVRRSSPRRSPRYSRSRSPRRSPSYDRRRSPPRREATRSRSPARRRTPSKSRSPAASPRD